MVNKYDFSGWATKSDIKCSDGRTILKDAFKQDDRKKVPLVWNHQHDDPSSVLGHAILENREEGVYAYCTFNDNPLANEAKELVKHADVNSLSIYANKLKTNKDKVIHGIIREVSLVLAGANPGAYIDSVLIHGDDGSEYEDGIIFTGEELVLEHSDAKKKEGEEMPKNDERTLEEIIETMNDEQKNAMNAIVALSLEMYDDENDDENDDDENIDEEIEGDDDMKHNVFENQRYGNRREDELIHSEFLSDVVSSAKSYGSMRDAYDALSEQYSETLQHKADEYGFDESAGFKPVFPNAVALNNEPIMIEKDNSWVAKVMTTVKHTPFSRVKSVFGRMTEESARAKGYIKGKEKQDSKMAVLNRVTMPTTIYIKSKIDRDDVVDITDFDVVLWQKRELRKALDREIALAILLGDGRDVSSEDKINEINIRPVIKDDDMFNIKYKVKKGVDYKDTTNSASDNDSEAKGIIRGAITARKNYKGSGQPTFFTTEDVLVKLLLIEDQNGRAIYDSVDRLATAMRVKEIVTLPEMEADAYKDIYGVIVNLADYTAGADKGGSVNVFDDFDIDYNQMKYLMETRISGALTVPFSAITLMKESAPTPPVSG